MIFFTKLLTTVRPLLSFLMAITPLGLMLHKHATRPGLPSPVWIPEKPAIKVKCITEVEKDDIELIYKAGTTIVDIADKYNRSTRTIYRILKERNIPLTGRKYVRIND